MIITMIVIINYIYNIYIFKIILYKYKYIYILNKIIKNIKLIKFIT